MGARVRKIKGEIYYSVAETARQLQVTPMTISRWIRIGVTIKGEQISVFQERIGSRTFYWIAKGSIDLLKHRFVRVNAPEASPSEYRSMIQELKIIKSVSNPYYGYSEATIERMLAKKMIIEEYRRICGSK